MQKNVIEYLLRTAETYPQKIAVQDSVKEITFAQLLEHAHILASRVRQYGIMNSPVGVYIPKGCDAVTAFAALSMSGNFYVPLDTKSPSSRVESIITVLDSKGGNITVTNCDVTGFGSLLVENDNTQTGTINTFTVDNCIFHDMASGKRFVDYQKKKSFIAEFTLKNSTFYNCCSGSDFIRFDRHSTKGNIINISNCTLYGIEATSKGLFYVRSNSVGNKDFTANITKCIFANMSNKVFFSQDTKTDNLTFNSNYYFEAPSLLSIPEGGAGKVVDATGVTLDPGFTDAANGNFKVSNQTIIDNEIGDPRWRK